MASLETLLNGQRVSRETERRLQSFATLFLKWATKINLIAPSTLDDLWSRHIADSLQLYTLSPEPKTWIDLGSGGGFPGIVTAIMLAEKGKGWVHLVESNQKKAAFLRVALQDIGARGSVHIHRIEEAPNIIKHCDAISARALADLSTLLSFAEPWAKSNPSLTAFFHKGRDYQRELDNARGRYGFDLVTHGSTVENDSVVLEITAIKRLDGGAGVAHVAR